MKQRNEGGWEFSWDEFIKPGFLLFDLKVSSYLDSSLIDVDIHPTFIRIIIKGKLLRLVLPCEVRVSESKCQRSKVTGSLLVIMPKVHLRDIRSKGDIVTVRPVNKSNITSNTCHTKAATSGQTDCAFTHSSDSGSKSRQKRLQKPVSLHDLMLLEATTKADILLSVPV